MLTAEMFLRQIVSCCREGRALIVAGLGVALLGLASSAGAASMGYYTVYGVEKVKLGIGTHVYGHVGSEVEIGMAARTAIYGSAHSGGIFHNNPGGYIGKSIYASGFTKVGKRTTVHGGVYTGGDIALRKNAHIMGNIYRTPGSTFTYDTTSSWGGEVLGTPTGPMLPGLPGATAFTAGGPDQIVAAGAGTVHLAPGTYGEVQFGKNTVLELSAGEYYMDSFRMKRGLELKLDVTAGDIKIYVTGDVDAHQKSTEIIGGDARNFWIETHANFNRGPGEWKGGVFAPFGRIHIGSGSSPTYVETPGLWAYNVNLEHGVKVHNPVPEPSSVALFAIGGLLVGSQVLRRKRANRA